MVKEAVLPSPAEEVQPATGAAETVLLHHHLICPLNLNNCLVQLSYQIWPQKTTESSPDCWAYYWYNPPHSPRTVLIQSEQKGWQIHSGPVTSHIQHTLSLNCYHLFDATKLRAPERPDTGTVYFLRQSISWKLDIKRGIHNTIIHYLFITHTYLHFNFHISYLYIHNCLYYILYFVHGLFCIFVYYYFYRK